MKSTTAIISLSNNLAAIGLRHLLEMNFGVKALCSAIDTLSEQTTRVGADLIFVDQQSFLANLDFLLPRRKNIVMLCENSLPSQQEIKTIDMKLSESELIDAMNTVIQDHGKQNQIQHSALSQREIEVLKEVVAGKINKEIAADLGISLNTVMTHRKNITAKLGIKSVSGLSFYALMNNLV